VTDGGRRDHTTAGTGQEPIGGRAQGEPPGRVVITSPRTRAATRPRHPGTREIDEQTRLGEVYMRSLVRSQLRLAVSVCLVVAGVVGGLPALFVLSPGLRGLRLLGVPLPWVLLAGLIYPMFVACAWWYVRQAEHTERDFAELVDRR
jgi:hypothetical protein